MRTKILTLGLTCLFIVSCISLPFMTSTKLKKGRPTYVNLHPELSTEIRKTILKGAILIGMTFEQVAASRGFPLDVSDFNDGTSQWVYVGIMSNARNQQSDKEIKLDHKYAYIYFKDGEVTSWRSRLKADN